MALVFAARSDDANFYARYSTAGKSGVKNPSSVIQNVDAGAIGGYNYDFSGGGSPARAGIYFRGANFQYNATGFSILYRFKPNYTGTPAATRGILALGSTGATGSAPNMFLNHAVTTGNLALTMRGTNGVILNAANLGVWSPTSGTWYDLVLTYDYSATASSFKCYIDAALFGSVSPTAAFDVAGGFPVDGFTALDCGAMNGSTAVHYMNEMVIWDTVIDPTSNVNLESGAGLLNGASRTSFVSDVAGATLTSYDGLASTGGSTHSSSFNWSN